MKELKLLFNTDFLGKEPMICVAVTVFGAMLFILLLMLCATYWISPVLGVAATLMIVLPVTLIALILKAMVRSSQHYKED